MTMPGKSLSTDLQTFRNDDADPVERASALSRLASDRRVELEPEVESWLRHEDPNLRTAAVRVLVGRWRLGRHVPSAEHMLKNEPDWVVRRNCAAALAMFAQDLPAADSNRARIVSLLTHCLICDGDAAVQEAVYEALLRIFGAPADRYFHENRKFDAARDADWDWLRAQAEFPSDFEGLTR